MTAFTGPGVDAALEYFAKYYGTEEANDLFPYFIADVLHAGVKSTGLSTEALIAEGVRVMTGDIEEAEAALATVPAEPAHTCAKCVTPPST